MGYLVVPWPKRTEGTIELDLRNVAGAKCSDCSIPFDVVTYDSSLDLPLPPHFQVEANPPATIVVFWVNEDNFAERPIVRLAQFKNTVMDQPCSLDGISKSQFVVLGPASSDLLGEMVQDANLLNKSSPKSTTAASATTAASTSADAKTITVASVLEGTRIFTPWATAPDEIVLNDPSGTTIASQLENDINVTFQRTIMTDDKVLGQLWTELQLRDSEHHPETFHIAVIAEWDTSYGRAAARSWQRTR